MNKIGSVLGVTRSAVGGQIYRLGLPKRKRVRGQNSDSTTVLKRVIRPRLSIRPTLPPQMVAHEIVEGAAYVATAATRKDLMGLASGDCRWPCGDPGTPDFFFCGAPQATGKPYCSAHCRIAYQPVRVVARKPMYREVAA
jgi:GcrA cell cycle regulator